MIRRPNIFCIVIGASLCTWNLLIYSPCFSQTPAADSLIIPASLDYKSPGLLIRLAIGNNYRKEWELPVKMPVFNITTEHGGFTITKLGGGKQTKSLRMVSRDSIEWSLRSVDKKVGKVLPRFFRHTIIETLAQNMISASHPYACLSTAALAKSVGVTGPDPQLFYVPDDTVLGEYRKDFAGSVCFLEEHHPLRPGTKPASMEDVLEGLSRHNNNIVIQRELLKARLLDMVTGDWDRHQDQWRWGKYDSIGKTWYYPIPVDRDQAFFRPKGILIRFISSVAMPFLKGFKPRMSDLYQLNKPARNFDKVFLNELHESDWTETIVELQSKLTDSIIESAVSVLPAEIPAKRKNKLIKVLRSRRDGMLSGGMKYYSRLARNAYLFGSEKSELFEITSTRNTLRVVVYNCDSSTLSCKIYDRTFQQGQTRRIYLVDVGINDKIDYVKNEISKIKTVIVKAEQREKRDLRNKILKRVRQNQQEKADQMEKNENNDTVFTSKQQRL